MDLEDESQISLDTKKYRIIIFNHPEDEMIWSSGSTTNDSLETMFYLNIRKFCERICAGAEKTIAEAGIDIDEKGYSIEIQEYSHC